MAARTKIETPKETTNYFASGTEKNLKFVSTGCALLDEVLGGGYVLGRVVNLVGDKSTGKTLLAIEASANFLKRYPKGIVRYAEAEAAFDNDYAAALGLPVERVEFADTIFTVEDFFEDLEKMLDTLKDKPCLYILDSLDALSDRAELERDIDAGTYGGNKPKQIGQLFRRLVQKLEHSNVLLIVISQIRDKIGVTFGETKTRSGGRALDFYATHIIWLSEVEKLKKVIDKVERVIGIKVRANCKKNKVGLPFRQCDFPLLFGYGVDDLTANVEWLLTVAPEKLTPMGLSKDGYKVRVGNIRNKGGTEVQEFRGTLAKLVSDEWKRVEIAFLPKCRKY